MTEYDDELTGVLFPNKTDNPKAPAFTGKATIQGEEYRLAAWKRQSLSSGKPFLSIKFESEAEREARMAEADPEGALDL